jgi:Sulfite exporter TauE/SafE.
MNSMDLLPFTDPAVYFLMAALIFGSAFLQGVGGVGFTMFSAPIAAIVCPELVPGPLLMLGGCVTFLTALRERHNIAWTSTGTALAGRVLGSGIAVVALAHLAQRPLNFLFAAMILLAVGMSAIGIRVIATQRNVAIAGVMSGIMGTLTSVGAPPLVITLQRLEPATIRATTGAILFFGSFVSLVMLSITGHFGVHELLLGATMVPFMLLGFWSSGRLRQLISAVTLRRGLLVFCALSAGGLIVKSI